MAPHFSTLALFGLLAVQSLGSNAGTLPWRSQIDALVKENFGPSVSAVADGGPGFPRYLRTPMVKAAVPVLVIPISADQAKGTLNARGVKAIRLPGQSGDVDESIGANCLGLAFFHGLPAGSISGKPSSVHLLYECFSGYTRVAKGAPLLRHSKPRADSDAVLLDLETGGQLLVYWSGNGYITRLVRRGD